MGSDGLWDELNRNDVASIVSENSSDRKIIAQTYSLFENITFVCIWVGNEILNII